MPRIDGREPEQLRPTTIQCNVIRHAEGSALVDMGGTRVLCAATVDERVPPFLKGTGTGWVTAEYGMLPRSSAERIPRDHTRSGRTQEIQRLVGRSLRAVTDLAAFGERQVILDCDVLEADGGTRTASVTGAFCALYDAFQKLKLAGKVNAPPLKDFVAAVSVGMLGSAPLLDLCYEEDHRAEVDMNVIMTGAGHFVELQGTAEQRPFDRALLDRMLALGEAGVRQLIELQKKALGIERL
ncbi:MAG TPA: ribonuclease PH [Candidatus Saccharimonadales bacterium]|nr:ribonuclease PH [Candidatus Saccharimonadales bacterium]